MVMKRGREARKNKKPGKRKKNKSHKRVETFQTSFCTNIIQLHLLTQASSDNRLRLLIALLSNNYLNHYLT